jgi:LPS export ABC transporter protein LptC
MNQVRIKWAIACGILLVLGACREETKPANVRYDGPMMEIDNIVTNYSDSARLVVKMTTAKQIDLQNRDKIYPKEIKLYFYDRAGVETTTLRADSGRYFSQNSVYKVMGKVRVYNKIKQESLETDELTWFPEKKNVQTDRPVKIVSPKDIIYGKGLTAKQDFSEYVIRSISGVVTTPVQ